MSKPKLTKWFPPEVKPARKGAYETRLIGHKPDGLFQYWNGRSWGCASETAKGAMEIQSMFESVAWRGLASEPKQ